ncbi:hypothetical protein COU54_03180 [Candidatus Pacearchaeota archaeon CG10_big_fil_rev_8_21_14_0_10_31_24]|nr:MAG: hypothetical protein COU54_03180 [Candidatus Pacearchaeota archaeon CG10_big_fil_rev_8_21_14_0_10_31_24]
MFDRSLGNSFKKIGATYHKGRRDYPQNLFKEIISLSNLEKNSSILDIGCGTGKSTLPFVKKGYDVIGIDISDNMLNIARRLSSGYKNIKYKKNSFESINLPENHFDLIIIGTAVHWLNPKIAYKKAYNLIKPRGYISIFWESIEFLKSLPEDIKLVLISNCPNYPLKSNKNKSIKKIEGRLKKNKFTKLNLINYHYVHEYNPSEFINLIKSYSWVISLNKKKKDKLFNELTPILDNNIIRLPKVCSLIIAQKN